MKILKHLKRHRYIIIAVIALLIILLGVFYFYKVHLKNARKNCIDSSIKSTLKWQSSNPGSTMDEFKTNYNTTYLDCLKKNSLI